MEDIQKEVNKKEEKEERRGNLERDFNMEELERALRNCKDKSSPGMDQIDYKMIKKLPNEMKKELRDIIMLFKKALCTRIGKGTKRFL